jgi:hypothetical protein
VSPTTNDNEHGWVADARFWREADEAHRADKPSLISAQRRLFIWRNERAREAIGFATISARADIELVGGDGLNRQTLSSPA